MESSDVDRLRVQENEIRQYWNERLMQVNNIELLLPQDCFNRVVECDIKRDTHHAAVGGNGNGPPDAVVAIARLESTLASARSQNCHIVPAANELGTQVVDVFVDATRMSWIVR